MRRHLLRSQQWLGVRLATLARRDDRGAITTETAVVTGLLIVAAGVVVGILSTKAQNWANAIPDGP